MRLCADMFAPAAECAVDRHYLIMQAMRVQDGIARDAERAILFTQVNAFVAMRLAPCKAHRFHRVYRAES